MNARAAILAAMPGTITALTLATGMSRALVKCYVKEARAAHESHIGAWVSRSGRRWPAHFAGAGADAPETVTFDDSDDGLPTGQIRAMGMLPAALMAQRSAFPLGEVWL